jgi:hypothetical protein
MPKNVTTKLSVSTFQQNNGNNFTTAGVDTSVKVGKGTLSSYVGLSTEFTNNTTGFVVDFKGSAPYRSGSILSGGFRVRNTETSTQIRIQPATINIPLGKTTAYATPYVLFKTPHTSGNITTKCGIFAGASQKVGDVNVFIEGQIYDIGNINKDTTSINLGVSIPIN